MSTGGRPDVIPCLPVTKVLCLFHVVGMLHRLMVFGAVSEFEGIEIAKGISGALDRARLGWFWVAPVKFHKFPISIWLAWGGICGRWRIGWSRRLQRALGGLRLVVGE